MTVKETRKYLEEIEDLRTGLKEADGILKTLEEREETEPSEDNRKALAEVEYIIKQLEEKILALLTKIYKD